jgi:hypothetical protein
MRSKFLAKCPCACRPRAAERRGGVVSWQPDRGSYGWHAQSAAMGVMATRTRPSLRSERATPATRCSHVIPQGNLFGIRIEVDLALQVRFVKSVRVMGQQR